MEINLVFVERRQLTERCEQVSASPEVSAVAISELLKFDDESLFERLGFRDRERRDFFDAPDIAGGRQISARRARKNTTAGREDHVRLVGERFDDDLSANSLRFADQPDDRVFGLRHLRATYSRRQCFLRTFR